MAKNSQNSTNLKSQRAQNSQNSANFSENSQIFLSQNELNALKQRLLSAKIYESTQWQRLLHFEKGKSTINKNSDFFLSKKGYKDARAEYVATIERFFNELNLQDKFTQNAEFSAPNSPSTAQNLKNSQSQNSPNFEQNSTKNSQDKIAPNAEKSIRCAYPARLHFIAQELNDEKFTKLTATSDCAGLNEFLQIVPLDELLLEFAAESDLYPGSAMGHAFLHLRGRVRQDIDTSIAGARFVRKKGDKQDYAMSYYAMMSEGFNPLDYARALSGTIKGFYVLNPYENAELDYLGNEQRSLYVFRVLAQKAQLRGFALHLWELKDRQIAYDFITHNCTNGIERVLAVLDSAFARSGAKPFMTPLEYIQPLEKAGKIELVQIKTPPKKQKFTQKFGHNDILRTRKASKIALGGTKNAAFLYLAPIYSDIKNANNAYKELIESRLMSVEMRVSGLWDINLGENSGAAGDLNGAVNSSLNLSGDGVNSNAGSTLNGVGGVNSNVASENSRKAKFFVHKIELLHLFSVPDTLRTGAFSKLISARLESNLYQKALGRAYTAQNNHDTRLFPTLDLGLGAGSYAGDFGFYGLLGVGYRYELLHNPYASLKSGVAASFSRVKLLAQYELFYDFNDDNRGYDSRLALFAGFNAFKQVDIFAKFNAYHQLFRTHKIFYEKKQSVNFRVGVSVNF